MKDSFLSFKDMPAKRWVINARGRYKKDVAAFLGEHLGDKLISYKLESSKGWFYDSRRMLEDIETDFVFFWIEDHINMVDISKYKEILNEMKEYQGDHLVYSWWYEEHIRKFDVVPVTESPNLKFYTMNRSSIRAIESCNKGGFYMISAVSILSARLFKKIVLSNHPRLKRFPVETPFDFEKKSTDVEFFNFNYVLPKYELFASIDDNNAAKYGYSLIDRGLYPNRVSKEELNSMEFKRNSLREYCPKVLLKPVSMVYRFMIRLKYTLK